MNRLKQKPTYNDLERALEKTLEIATRIWHRTPLHNAGGFEKQCLEDAWDVLRKAKGQDVAVPVTHSAIFKRSPLLNPKEALHKIMSGVGCLIWNGIRVRISSRRNKYSRTVFLNVVGERDPQGQR